MNTKRKCEPCGIMEDWFLRVTNLEQVTITQTSDINELQLIVNDLEAAVIGNVNLSLLVINTDKDWLGYDITHIGDLGVDGDITVGGSISPDADNLSDLGTTTNRFRFGRIRQVYVDEISIAANMSLTGLISTSLRPQVSNTLDLGSGYYKWRNLYLQGDVITDGLIDNVDIASHVHDGTASGGAKISLSNLLIDANKDMNDKALTNLSLLTLNNTANATLTASSLGRLKITNPQGNVELGVTGPEYTHLIAPGSSGLAINNNLILYSTNRNIGNSSNKIQSIYMSGDIINGSLTMVKGSNNTMAAKKIRMPSADPAYYRWTEYKNIISGQAPGGNGTGMVVIKTKMKWNNSDGVMSLIKVHGWDYYSNEIINFDVGSYFRNSAMNRCVLKSYGTDSYDKKYGVDENGNFCICIGGTSSSMYGMGLCVDASIGWTFYNDESYGAGWSLAVVDSTTNWIVQPTVIPL